jgi:hypothetical protein
VSNAWGGATPAIMRRAADTAAATTFLQRERDSQKRLSKRRDLMILFFHIGTIPQN